MLPANDIRLFESLYAALGVATTTEGDDPSRLDHTLIEVCNRAAYIEQGARDPDLQWLGRSIFQIVWTAMRGGENNPQRRVRLAQAAVREWAYARAEVRAVPARQSAVSVGRPR